MEKEKKLFNAVDDVTYQINQILDRVHEMSRSWLEQQQATDVCRITGLNSTQLITSLSRREAFWVEWRLTLSLTH